MGRLDGKVAVITGGGSGMGRTAVLLFAREGSKVVAVDISAAAGEETLKMAKGAGADAIFVRADVSKAEDVKDMIRKAVDVYGKLNVLYNNAAITEPVFANTADCTEENWDKVHAIDLKGCWFGMKYAIPAMIKTGGGFIINVSSQAAVRGNFGIPSYSAADSGSGKRSPVWSGYGNGGPADRGGQW